MPPRIKRKYTGWDKNADGKRWGTERFVKQLEIRTSKALWSNGTWGVRPMRGKTSPSVHGTGRAIDVSWRNMKNGKGKPRGRKVAMEWMKKLSANAEALGIEMIIDYGRKPFGRAWRCDRNMWKVYRKPTVQHGGRGDWFHVELTNEMADSAQFVNKVWDILFGTFPPSAWCDDGVLTKEEIAEAFDQKTK